MKLIEFKRKTMRSWRLIYDNIWPLLHQAFKFQEDYSLALEGFSTAAMLDPSWDEAKAKEEELMTYLKGVQEMVETKVLIADCYW